MKRSLRVRLLALAGLVGGAQEVGGADAETLPGIFAPKRVSEVPPPPPLLARRSGNSDRMSAIIAERVQARVKELDTTALPITRPAGELSRVVMEKVVVAADKVRRVDPAEAESPALRFLRTGRVFESRDGTTTGDVRLAPVRPSGALPKEDVMRVEISISRKF